MCFHFVQKRAWGYVWEKDEIQKWKKEAKEWDEKVKKNEKAIKQFKEKKEEQYEGELWVILCSSVNTADWLQILKD